MTLARRISALHGDLYLNGLKQLTPLPAVGNLGPNTPLPTLHQRGKPLVNRIRKKSAIGQDVPIIMSGGEFMRRKAPEVSQLPRNQISSLCFHPAFCLQYLCRFPTRGADWKCEGLNLVEPVISFRQDESLPSDAHLA